jgi:hypothetical protein
MATSQWHAPGLCMYTALHTHLWSSSYDMEVIWLRFSNEAFPLSPFRFGFPSFSAKCNRAGWFIIGLQKSALILQAIWTAATITETEYTCPVCHALFDFMTYFQNMRDLRLLILYICSKNQYSTIGNRKSSVCFSHTAQHFEICSFIQGL